MFLAKAPEIPKVLVTSRLGTPVATISIKRVKVWSFVFRRDELWMRFPGETRSQIGLL